MSDEIKRLAKECVEVNFLKQWRGHDKGSTAKISKGRSMRLLDQGIAKATSEGARVLSLFGIKTRTPKSDSK